MASKIDEAWDEYRKAIDEQIFIVDKVRTAQETLDRLKDLEAVTILETIEAGEELQSLMTELGIEIQIAPIVELPDATDDFTGAESTARSGTLDYYEQPGKGIPKPLGVDGVMTVVAVVKA